MPDNFNEIFLSKSEFAFLKSLLNGDEKPLSDSYKRLVDYGFLEKHVAPPRNRIEQYTNKYSRFTVSISNKGKRYLEHRRKSSLKEGAEIAIAILALIATIAGLILEFAK